MHWRMGLHINLRIVGAESREWQEQGEKRVCVCVCVCLCVCRGGSQSDVEIPTNVIEHERKRI